jgi:uncharacterized RDD family membrane protein YckC
MDWEKRYDMDTPELVPVRYDVVGLGSRFVGYAIDNTIIFSVIALVVLVVMLSLMALGVSFDFDIETLGGMALNTVTKALIAFLTLFFFTFYWGYHVFFETARFGRSPGKRYAGIQVVKADGSPITFRDSLIRNLLRIVDMLPTGYVVGSVAMLRSPRGQRLGDKLAGTIVIRNRGMSYLDPAGAEQEIRIKAQPDPGMAVSRGRLTDRESEIVISFLRRRETLDAERRVEIARRIAHQIAYKYQMQGYNPNFPEHFLEQLVAGG